MQVHELKHHRAHQPIDVNGVNVRWSLVDDGRIMFRFRVDGCGLLTIPQEGPCDRLDNLWKSTCFEIFVHRGNGRYVEYNFSPSRAWAAYEFSSYRQKHADYVPERVPEISSDQGDNTFVLNAFLPLVDFIGGDRIGVCSVLEEKPQNLSYWALRHPDDEPDFHNPACFALQLD